MPGAGKSTVAACLQKKGMPLIVMGDVIRSRAVKSNLEPSDGNLGRLMLELRKKMGKGVYRLCHFRGNQGNVERKCKY